MISFQVVAKNWVQASWNLALDSIILEWDTQAAFQTSRKSH